MRFSGSWNLQGLKKYYHENNLCPVFFEIELDPRRPWHARYQISYERRDSFSITNATQGRKIACINLTGHCPGQFIEALWLRKTLRQVSLHVRHAVNELPGISLRI
jgi:hypothetical protein